MKQLKRTKTGNGPRCACCPSRRELRKWARHHGRSRRSRRRFTARFLASRGNPFGGGVAVVSSCEIAPPVKAWISLRTPRAAIAAAT